jgi:regulator of sigma E protease
VSEGLRNGLYIVPILGLLILVHEIGHFVAARLIGVKVEEFGIGIPPRLVGWRHRGVLWSLNWIPFGGFVKVLGEDSGANDPASFNAKSPLQRAFFLGAGSLMNFALAFLLMILIVGFQGVSTSNTYIAEVVPGSPAEAAGWQAGDRIVEVAGVPVASSTDVGARTREFAGRPLSVVVARDGSLIDTSVTPRTNPPPGEGATGVGINDAVISETTVESVAPDSAASAAGLEPGDRIVTIGSEPISDPFALQFALLDAADSTVPVEVQRGGELTTVSLPVPNVTPDSDLFAAIGLTPSIKPIFESVPLGSVIPVGIEQAWGQTTQMVSAIRDLIIGLITGQAPLGSIAGPLGMGQATSEIVSASPLPLWVTLTQLTILLSLNLAMLNLLPIPALDGGRLLFVIIEVLRGGRKLAPEREGLVHVAGLILLLGVMAVVFAFDAMRIFGGQTFLSQGP